MLIILAFQTAGDRQKFEWLYSNYKKLLLHKAYGILRDYQLAEDAVSEAMIRIYKNLDKIEDVESNRTIAFLVTITKNTALTLLQKASRQKTEPVEETFADRFDLEEHVLSELSAQSVFSLVDGLNEELKNVFLLKYAYDMSHREIGKALNITENNVTVRLHRAKKKLLAQINEREQAEPGEPGKPSKQGVSGESGRLGKPSKPGEQIKERR